MARHLRLVGETEVCVFCGRSMPVEEMRETVGGSVCADPDVCVAEARRQESELRESTA